MPFILGTTTMSKSPQPVPHPNLLPELPDSWNVRLPFFEGHRIVHVLVDPLVCHIVRQRGVSPFAVNGQVQVSPSASLFGNDVSGRPHNGILGQGDGFLEIQIVSRATTLCDTKLVHIHTLKFRDNDDVQVTPVASASKRVRSVACNTEGVRALIDRADPVHAGVLPLRSLGVSQRIVDDFVIQSEVQVSAAGVAADHVTGCHNIRSLRHRYFLRDQRLISGALSGTATALIRDLIRDNLLPFAWFGWCRGFFCTWWRPSWCTLSGNCHTWLYRSSSCTCVCCRSRRCFSRMGSASSLRSWGRSSSPNLCRRQLPCNRESSRPWNAGNISDRTRIANPRRTRQCTPSGSLHYRCCRRSGPCLLQSRLRLFQATQGCRGRPKSYRIQTRWLCLSGEKRCTCPCPICRHGAAARPPIACQRYNSETSPVSRCLGRGKGRHVHCNCESCVRTL